MYFNIIFVVICSNFCSNTTVNLAFGVVWRFFKEGVGMEVVWAERFVPTRFSCLALALNFKTLSVLRLVRFPQMFNGRNCKHNLSKTLNSNTGKLLCTLLLFLTVESSLFGGKSGVDVFKVC